MLGAQKERLVTEVWRSCRTAFSTYYLNLQQERGTAARQSGVCLL